MTGAQGPRADNGDAELVVLVDESGAPIGSIDKRTVHTAETPLHLAFSCYLLGDDGRLLLTRRALAKATWPGVWTNSFCGHPAPEEKMSDAVRRRAAHELGAGIRSLRLVLPGFRYRATDAGGVVENEVCPVFIAVLDGDLTPNPEEVAEWEWVRPEELVEAVGRAPFAFSPWLVEQLAQMDLVAEAGRAAEDRAT